MNVNITKNTQPFTTIRSKDKTKSEKQIKFQFNSYYIQMKNFG